MCFMKISSTELRKEYLRRVYELTEGHPLKSIHGRELAVKLNISNEEENKIYSYLKEKGLVKAIFQGGVTLTSAGIDMVEDDINRNYEESEYKVLLKIFADGRFRPLNIDEVAESLSMSREDLFIFLVDFKTNGWIDLSYAEIHLLPAGITAFAKWRKKDEPLSNYQPQNVYNTNVYGKSSNQIGGQNNTQNAINSTIMEIDDKTKNRYKVLEEIYRLSGANPVDIVVIDQIEKNTQISTHEMNGILLYLESKDLIEFPGGDIVRIKSRGIDEVERAKNHPEEKTDNFPPQINNITNIHGNFYGGLQQGGEGNTQNNQVNVNPDFNNAIKELIDLVNNSDLHILEKEERLAEIDRIQQLAQREQTPEVQELGLSKVKLLETGLKVGEMALKASPLIGILAKLFGG